jgi:Domain of unknown function (DUF4265)
VTDSSLVKVLFEEDENVETLWAQPVGPGHYRIDNSPFWAYGVSWQDVVEARPDSDGRLRFVRVVTKSGHRTVRLFLKPPADKSPKSQSVLDGLNAIGATYERMNAAYVSIDLDPHIALDSIVSYLVASGQQWEYADPSYDVLFPDSAIGDSRA